MVNHSFVCSSKSHWTPAVCQVLSQGCRSEQKVGPPLGVPGPGERQSLWSGVIPGCSEGSEGQRGCCVRLSDQEKLPGRGDV